MKIAPFAIVFSQIPIFQKSFLLSVSSFDPELNRIWKAKFSIDGVIGLLDKHDILID